MTDTTAAPHHPTAPVLTDADADTHAPRRPGRLLRLAGLAAVVEGLAYVVGLGLMAAYLAPAGFLAAQDDPASSLDFLLDHRASLYLWYLVIYLVAGLALVALTQGLVAVVRPRRPVTAGLVGATGLMWSGLVVASGLVALVGQTSVADLAATDREQAVTTWSAVTVVQDALGGGIELVGAVWVLLLAVAGLATGCLPRWISWLGVATGAAGVATLVPALADGAASAFGLGFIVWFLGVGHTLLRR